MSRRNSGEPPADGNAADSDDNEFGEFEGFEGAVGGAAHPAPSPWATFPDLVRVRTSPGNSSADDAGIASQQGHRERPHGEAQSDPAVGGRSRNPPDVSLSARDAGGDDVNLLNFTPNSHQRVLPDMAAESELRHINPTGPREAGLHHVAEVRPTRRQCDQSGALGGGARLREQVPSSPQNHASGPYHEPNDVLQRRLATSEDRVRELEVQLAELRAREARTQRYTEEAVAELRAARETILAHERVVRSLVERIELASARSLQDSSRLATIETRLDQLSAQLSALAPLGGDARLDASGTALTREDVMQAVREAMSRQPQRVIPEDERRRLLRSLAESFQTAVTQFIESLNKEGGDR